MLIKAKNLILISTVLLSSYTLAESVQFRLGIESYKPANSSSEAEVPDPVSDPDTPDPDTPEEDTPEEDIPESPPSNVNKVISTMHTEESGLDSISDYFASSSNFKFNMIAASAFDGYGSQFDQKVTQRYHPSGWQSAEDKHTPSFLGVRFKEMKTVGGVAFSGGYYKLPTRFNIQFSQDSGNTWITAASKQQYYYYGMVIPFIHQVQANAVRIEMLGVHYVNGKRMPYVGISEFEVLENIPEYSLTN